MTLRAAIYARVSRAYTPNDDRLSIESQLADCRAWCDSHGYTITAEFVDKDMFRVDGRMVNPSGERKDRPGYLALLRAASGGEIDVIVCWKEDRLYRGMYAAIPLAEVLDRRHDLRVDLVQETFDRRMLGIKAAVGKIELENIRDRMIRGRQARLERGRMQNAATHYGYQRVGGDLVIDEAEAGIVRDIFEWYTRGENNMAIRRRLNALGIATRRGQPLWSKSTIQNILTFDGYATGEYTTTLSGKTFTLACPVIISRDTWQRATEQRQRNKNHRGRNIKQDYLCAGLVTCPCGWKWEAKTWRNPDRPENISGRYECPKRNAAPESQDPDCPSQIGAKKLDSYIWATVARICNDPALLQRAVDARVADLRSRQAAMEDDTALKANYDRLAAERRRLITLARKGIITDGDLAAQLSELATQANDLNRRRDEITALRAAHRQADVLQKWIADYLQAVGAGLAVLDTPAQGLAEEAREVLFITLEAGQFLQRFDGDRLAALNWALLEERRRIVKTLIRRVIVSGRKGEARVITPVFVFDLPLSLDLPDQSKDYRPTGLDEFLASRPVVGGSR